MARRILWLCSWYPHNSQPFDGDFVQRHAEAVSAYGPIDVLHVSRDEDGTQQVYEKRQPTSTLTEHLYTYKVDGNSWLKQLKGWIQYFKIHVKFIRSYGKPDLIHVHIPLKAGLVALWYKFSVGVPYIVSEHYGIYNASVDDHYKTRSFFFRFATKLIFRYANALTTVSESLGNEINSWVLHKPFTVIPNVVDTKLFRYTPGVQQDKFQFIHISNMIPLKNVEGILQACALLAKERSDFSLLLVGGINKEHEAFAREHNLLNTLVFFAGVIPYAKVASMMQQSEALIIFSDSESQSCVVLEALCSGRPVIVTNVGGVKELVNETNGLKVNVRATADLVKAMSTMMNNYNRYQQQAIAEQAHALYAYPSVAAKFETLYQQILV